MNKKLVTHIVFLVYLIALYGIFSLIFRSEIPDILQVSLYYAIVVVLVFCINLIKKRKTKWIVFVLGIFFPITYLTFDIPKAPFSSSLDVLLNTAPMNAPFLGTFIPIVENKGSIPILFYFLYFVLPLLYFYFLYFLAKKTTKNILKNKGD